MEALDDFQTRHKTITEKINETYRMGRQMIDYLECQIILDYHWRGEQDIFEQEYPNLKKKAEALLGYDTYFDLSPLTGQPLSEESHPHLYNKLLKVQAKIAGQLDTSLEKHNIKIETLKQTLEGTPDELFSHSDSDETESDMDREDPTAGAKATDTA